MKVVVGPSEMQIGNTLEVVLTSTSLGSGVGIAVYDPGTNVGGILHFLLPSSIISRSRAQENPFLFADTGIPAFLEAMNQTGAKNQALKVVVAGGSQILDQETPYDIAQRNCLAAGAILAENNVSISHEDFGGNFYRNMRIEGGDIYIEIPGHGEKKI